MLRLVSRTKRCATRGGRAGQHNRRNDAALLRAEPRGLPPRSGVRRAADAAPTSMSAAAIPSPTTCRSGSTSRAGAAWWSSRSRRWPTSTPTCARATTPCRCLAGRAEGEAEFHVVDKLHGFSTTVREHAAGAGQFGAGFTTIVKPVRTLAALIAEAGLDSHRFPEDRRGGRGGRGAGGHGLRAPPPARGAGRSGGAGQHGRRPGARGSRDLLAQRLSLRLLRPPQPLLRGRGGQGPGRALSRRARAPGTASSTCGTAAARRSAADHPDHKLAQVLQQGFFAELPSLDPALLRRLIERRGSDLDGPQATEV